MNLVIAKLLKVLGWQKLLLLTWGAIQPDLKKHAEKTENQVDDKLVEIADEMIKAIAA